jgi:hypothetical protein
MNSLYGSELSLMSLSLLYPSSSSRQHNPRHPWGLLGVGIA